MPNRFFNCANMMMSDVADVKPDVTGIDIKSTKKPETIIKTKQNC